MAQDSPQAVEFSRLVPRDRLLEGDGRHEIEATAEERQALARRFGLLALDRLVASLRLRPKAGPGLDGEQGLIRLTGQFEAEVVQACVVTLEPLRNRLEEDFELLYSLGASDPGGERPEREQGELGKTGGEVVFAPDDAEPPEPIGPAGLDLGEAVAQQLAVAIDPYPRAPGAALEAVEWPRRGTGEGGGQGAGDDAETGPFAALRRLKQDG